MAKKSKPIIKKFIINRCINTCNFYSVSMDGMECKHPYFKDKGAYANMIIYHNGKAIPEECPLRKETLEVTHTYIYELKKRV